MTPLPMTNLAQKLFASALCPQDIQMANFKFMQNCKLDIKFVEQENFQAAEENPNKV